MNILLYIPSVLWNSDVNGSFLYEILQVGIIEFVIVPDIVEFLLNRPFVPIIEIIVYILHHLIILRTIKEYSQVHQCHGDVIVPRLAGVRPLGIYAECGKLVEGLLLVRYYSAALD